MCLPPLVGHFEHDRELVGFEIVRVLLRRPDLRVAEGRLHGNKIVAAFAKQSRRKSVPELMRNKPPHAGTPADPVDHSPERLLASRLLWVFQSSYSLELRDPLFDLGCEYVVVELRLQVPERCTELLHDVRREREV